jgi:AraC family transcriptional regulator
MQVEIRDIPELRVGGVPHRGPYNQISDAFTRLGQIAGAAGLFQQPGAVMVGIYHDDPESTAADQLRSDAGIVVPNGVTLPAGLTEQHLPAGRYACTVHVGPYETLGDTWMRLKSEWLRASGERVSDGSSYEYYLNDPRTTPRDRLETEIRIPLA